MTRPFTAHERAILEYLVGADPIFRAQVDAGTFREEWFEGSQSFDIEIADDAPLDPRPPTMSDGRRVGPGCMVYLPGQPHRIDVAQDGPPLGELFLWIIRGKIDSLEYPWFSDEMPDRLPELSQLGPVDARVYAAPLSAGLLRGLLNRILGRRPDPEPS